KTKREIDQIISAVRELSRSKTGALIVIEPSQGERDYVSPGTTVNANITTTLLLTIFFQNSPLHDGAVVIRQDKIVAAGVILPMTDDPQLSYRYGTRHRAAIGLSETYDGLCIVVSEETGAISAASRGMLARYKSADDLREPILYLYTQGGDSTSPNPMSNFLSLFSMARRESAVQAALNAELESNDDRTASSDMKVSRPSSKRTDEKQEVTMDPDKKRRSEEQRVVEGERKSERARRRNVESQTKMSAAPITSLELNSEEMQAELERVSGSESEDEIDDFLSAGSVKK
ncbi:MAG: DNA integrity scanning protein DisA nucleotide-binding domain protein, partial [Candidatus Obscuribacterales bacterium]|nr:DNA integrity scanning protein DisA nucleotide-binding domain protein [Candidatus Obscuribacterales bacterium]